MKILPTPAETMLARAARENRPTPPWRHASWAARLAAIAVLCMFGMIAALLSLPAMAFIDYLLHG